ncbi:MAG: tetratricopeptide repeat protein [bacterium]
MKEWIEWDRGLRRAMLGWSYAKSKDLVIDTEALFRESRRYFADPEAVDLAVFRALSPAAQMERRELAQFYLGEAERFEIMIWEHVAFIKEEFALTHPKGYLESMARCMGKLTTAVGLDPGNPEPWYDLAYLCGVVGDQVRYRQCLDATVAAIGKDETGLYRNLRHRLALDYAWYCRDNGWMEDGLVWADRADALKPEEEESILVRGLLLADLGEFQAACELAAQIRSIKIKRPMWGVIPSDFAENWIQSQAYRGQGNMLLACFVIGHVFFANEFPYANRYYNDIGMMAELNGTPRQATEYYGLAATGRPFFVYFPLKTVAGPPRIFGRGHTEYPYSLAFDRFQVAGSLYAYGAQMALSCEMADDPDRKAEFGELALDALSACRRRSIRPTSALALRGRVHFNLDNYAQAEADLALACEEMDALGWSDHDVCALAGRLKVHREEYGAALPHLARAIKAEPDQASTWRLLGVAALYENDIATGRQAFDIALDLAPESPASWYNRGLLHFHQREYAAASDDLEQAQQLAPEDEQITVLLERAVKARPLSPAGTAGRSDSGSLVQSVDQSDAQSDAQPDTRQRHVASDTGAVSISQQGSDNESVAGTVSWPRRQFWQTDSPQQFRFSDRDELDQQDDVAAMYSAQPFGGLASGRDHVGPERLQLSEAELQRIVAACEANYRRDTSRLHRRQLALAYVRSGQMTRGRDLLLPFWNRDIDLAEMCVVLEADRALGDASRARQFAGSLVDGPPSIEDPIFWSLVAFVCLDMGLNEEGLRALDAAISFDPDNLALKSQREFINRSH